MTARQGHYYLRPNVAVEPLIDRWYAWSHLIAPATYARNLTHRHLPIMDSYVAAPDAARTIAGVEGNADFAVVADFDDYAAFQAYTSHEAHKRLASDLLAPVLGSRTAIQIEIPGR